MKQTIDLPPRSLRVWISHGELRLPGDLTVKQVDDQHLALSGKANGKQLEVTLHKLKREDFLLINRGYHWINEYPYNR